MSVVIAGEKVFLDTTTKGIGIVNLTSYNVNETVKHLFKSNVPTVYDTCEPELFAVFLSGLKYRLKMLETQRTALLKERGATVSVRALLDHVQKLGDYIEKVKKATDVTCKKSVQPSEALPIKLPMDFTEEKVQELVRKFAVLILHAKEPKRLDAALDTPAYNVITKIDSIKNLTPEFEAAHTNPYPVLQDLVSLAKIGHSAFLDTLFTGLLDKMKPLAVPFSAGLDTAKTPAEQLVQLIQRLMAAKTQMEAELRKVNTQADELQAQVEAAEKEAASRPDYVSMAAETDVLRRELSAAKGQRDKLTIDLAELEGICDKAKIDADEAAAKAAGRIAELESEQKSADAKISQLTAELTTKESATVASLAEHTRIEKEVIDLQTELAQVKAAQGDVKARDQRLAEMQATLQKAQTHLDTAEKRHIDTEKAMRDMASKLGGQIAEEKARLAALQAEHGGLTKALADSKAAYAIVLGERDAALRQGGEASTTAVAALEKEHERVLAAEKALDEEKGKVAGLKTELGQARAALASSQAKETTVSGTAELDKQRRAAAEAKVVQLSSTLAAAERYLAVQTHEVEVTSKALAEIKKQFASLQNSAEETKANLERELTTLRESSSASIDELEAACKERVDAALKKANETFQNELKKQVDASSTQQANISKRIAVAGAQFKAELEGFEAALREKNEEIARIHKTKDEDIRRALAGSEAEKAALKADLEKQSGQVRDKAALDIQTALAQAEARCAEHIARIKAEAEEASKKAIATAVEAERKKGQELLGTAVQQADGRGRAAVEQEKQRSKAALDDLESKLLQVEQEKQRAITEAVAAASSQKKAEFSQRLSKLSSDDATKLSELTAQKDKEKNEAVEAAKKDVARAFDLERQRLLAQKEGELQLAKKAAAAELDKEKQRIIAQKEGEIQSTTAAAAQAIAQKVGEEERKASLAKLKDFAARVLTGQATSNDYKGPGEEPLRNIIKKIDSMKSKDICVLAYFVHYFMTHLVIPREIDTQLNAFVGTLPSLFDFILAVEPSLLLANKIQGGQPMRYFIEQSVETLGFMALASKTGLDARKATKIVRGDEAPPMLFYAEPTKSRVLLIVKEGTVDTIRKYEGGILTDGKPQDKTNPSQITEGISYDVLFLSFLYATRAYVKDVLTKNPSLCTVNLVQLDDKAPPPPKPPALCVPMEIRVMGKSDVNVIQLHPDHLALFNEDPFCFRVDGKKLDASIHSKVNLNYRDVENALSAVIERFCSGKNPVQVNIPPGFYQPPDKNKLLPIQDRSKTSSTVFDLRGYGGRAKTPFVCSASGPRPGAALPAAKPKLFTPGSGRESSVQDDGTRLENFAGGGRNTRKIRKHRAKKFTQRKR